MKTSELAQQMSWENDNLLILSIELSSFLMKLGINILTKKLNHNQINRYNRIILMNYY